MYARSEKNIKNLKISFVTPCARWVWISIGTKDRLKSRKIFADKFWQKIENYSDFNSFQKVSHARKSVMCQKSETKTNFFEPESLVAGYDMI